MYKLRLLDYDIDYDGIDKLNVTFSDVLQTADGLSDQQSIIDKITNMASSYNYTQYQANQGSKSKVQIENWRENGLALTNLKIMNNADNQDVLIDSHGILCRQYDEIADKFLDTQLKIVNSTMAITDDNWRTTKTAIGKFFYQDPVTGTYKSAYGVNGEVVIGRLILGQQLGIYAEDNKMIFDRNGLEITNNVNTFKVNPSSNNLFVLSNEDNDLIYVSSTGELHIKGDGDIQSLNYVANTSGMRIDLSSGAIDTKNFKVNSNGSATMADVTITSGIIQSANYVADTTGTKINLSNGTIDSKYFKVSSTGSVTIGSGTIQSSNYATNASNEVTAGTKINLSNGSILSKNFNVSSSGSVTMNNATLTGGTIQSSNYATDTDNNVTAGTKINLSNGSISSKNFSVSSSGAVTMSSATLTGGTIKTANYIYGSTGMQISLSSGTIYTPNFYVNSSGNVTANNITLGSSNGNGTLSNINDDKTGVKLTNGRIELYHGRTSSGTTTAAILGRITPIAWSSTSSQYDIYSRSGVNYNDSSSDITMSFLGSYNFSGLTFGYTSGSNSDVTPLYQINWGSKATSYGCTHLFRDTIKFVASKSVMKAGQFKSCVNFANNYGLAWGGNIGLRYWNTSASPTGLWLGIVGSDIDGNTISCPTVITGSQMNVKCSSVFNASATFNYGITMATCSMDFNNNYGLSWGGNIGLRYANSSGGVSRTGVWLGISNTPTILTGNEIHANVKLLLHNGIGGMTDDYTYQHIIRHGSDYIDVGNDNSRLYLYGSNIYSNGSTVATTSDERKKEQIMILNERYLNLIKNISPVSFKYVSDISLSGRKHTGFIAQNVLTAMENAGITTDEFAAFVDVNNDGKEYALRYDEFIALLLLYSKHLEERIEQLEERLGA